ncbi:uncharacterized protein PSFLO_00645 [Pseudozyma flocculosa]|uniref:Uncharacterized protein n=1 Tax=Pseudozyma flocculosa TaxID=84751 RepID=A0A5C3ES83_9BASI|nr:uncharacterized protein PSFLO_00645 [Pseudozyma flocculosa]
MPVITSRIELLLAHFVASVAPFWGSRKLERAKAGARHHAGTLGAGPVLRRQAANGSSETCPERGSGSDGETGAESCPALLLWTPWRAGGFAPKSPSSRGQLLLSTTISQSRLASRPTCASLKLFPTPSSVPIRPACIDPPPKLQNRPHRHADSPVIGACDACTPARCLANQTSSARRSGQRATMISFADARPSRVPVRSAST